MELRQLTNQLAIARQLKGADPTDPVVIISPDGTTHTIKEVHTERADDGTPGTTIWLKVEEN